MESRFFWNQWTRQYRSLFLVLASLLMFSGVLLWWYYFQGATSVIRWETIQEQKVIETTVHSFRLGPFTLSVPGESYAIFEYFSGSNLQHNTTVSYIFLGLVVGAALVLLTIITTLERFWFFAGLSLFIVFVVSLRLDVPLLFGIQGLTVPIATIVTFVGMSYYFKSFRPETSFISRLLAFTGVTAIMTILFILFSKVQFPILHLAITAYTPGMVLSILFIIMIAHEIPAAFVYVTNQGSTEGLRHFVIVSAIYLVNVILAAVHQLGVINWDFIYLNTYLLITASTILGLWGFRIRETRYENIFPFAPFGAYLYLALAMILFATTAQLLGNANDAALRIIRHVIIFSHAGFGIVFLLYFFSNFMVMMAEGKPVYRLLYKPNRMPYFTFRLAGLIATLAFLFVANWRTYVYHGLAGFYNYIGDLYVSQGNDAFGLSFYEQSRNRAYNNNRANYALGKMKTERLRIEDAARNYQLANESNPTEFSLVNAGNINFFNARFFDAIQSFRAAKALDRGSARLDVNLAYSYAKVHNIDSAAFFINQARGSSATKDAAATNFLAMAAAEFLPMKIDSIVKLFETQSPAVYSNAIALGTLLNQKVEPPFDVLPSQPLNLYTATLLNNFVIDRAKEIDSAYIENVNKVALDSNNSDYSEAILSSLAHAYYHQGNVRKAFEMLAALSFTSPNYRGKYNYILGLWTLEQGRPDIASTYFNFAETADYKDARFYNAIALTEAGKVSAAIEAWQLVAEQGDESEKQLAQQIQTILQSSSTDAITMQDPQKYQFTRYRLSHRDTIVFNKIVSSFSDKNYQAQALLDMCVKQYKADQIISAIQYMNKISGLQLSDKGLYDDIRYQELRMLASRGEVATLAEQINKGVELGKGHELEKLLYMALIAESNQERDRARQYYTLLGRLNPFFEDGIMGAANFFRAADPKSMKPYDILVEAIQTNSTSIRLLKAYAAEASRKGFDEFAASAVERFRALETASQ